MPSEQEILTKINALENKLGVNKGFISEADIVSKINATEQRLASMPMSMDEFVEKRRVDSVKSTSEKASAFGTGFVEGVKGMAKEGAEALEEVPWYWMTGVGSLYDYDTLGDILNIGSRDFTRFAKTLGGAIMDKAGPYSNSEEIDREYKRYRENFDYYEKVRPKMLESDDIEHKKLVSFGANFVDPFMIFPVAKAGAFATKTTLRATQAGLTAGAKLSRSQGLVNVANKMKSSRRAIEKLERGVDIAGKIGAYPTEMAARVTARALRKGIKGSSYLAGVGLKGVGRLGQGTAFMASLPRKAVEKTAKAISKKAEDVSGFAVGGQLVGGLTGSVPLAMELGIAEGVGLIAKKVGLGFGEVLKTLGQPASNKRFLYRLATNSKVSPATRKRAMYVYNHYGTAVGDAMFNGLANGLSVGAINAGLAGLAGEDYENMGAMAGGGFLAGGFIPTGQQGMKAGKTDFARDTASIDAHMKNKLTQDQREAFVKMPRPAQIMLSTLQEAGIGSPKFMIMEPKAYLEMLNASRRQKNIPELDRAPKGHFDKPSRTIYINESNLPQSSKVATELIAHETGHDFIYRAIGDDPTMLQLLIEPYITTEAKGTAFHYRFDNKGNPLGDPVYLDSTAVSIQRDYDSKQRGRPATAEDVTQGIAQREGELIGGISIGKDASKLAQEIGAEQFAMMQTKNPNAFENFHPRLRRHLLDASRRLLGVLGVVEPSSGNPLSKPISKAQLDNPSIRRIYENYGRARAIELDEKGQLAKKGMLIQPKKGQTGEDRFVELFGGNGLSLTEAKNLVISNKTLRREIDAMKKRYKENPEDGWSTTKRGFLIGKKLTNDLRTIFTRNDPFRNVATILNSLQEAIDQRVGIIFGYRSGTKSKYQNPFRIRDVAIYGWQVSAGTLKVLGYDQAVVRQNMQTLVEKGYVKDIKDFEKRLAEQGQKALADPEGRINPEGRKENEIMTVAFGLKESAGEVASPGLRDLLESGVIKKTFRSYDVEALAGIRRGEKKAFAFDYENIRNNYNPFRQSEQLFMPVEVQEGSPSSLFKRRSAGNKLSKTRNFKNSVYMKDGSRLSGVAENETQDPFIGFDKSGQAFSIQREFVKPEDITGSKDGDKIANTIKGELENKGVYPIYKNPKKAIDEGTHGAVVQKGIRIDQKLADQLFSPASAAYFDAGFSPETYVGKAGFPMMADRMKTTPHVARDGTEFELRGGPDHPDIPINEGKVGWASMAGGQATQLQNAINSTDGIGLVTLMNEDAVASNRTFARIMIHELKHDRKTNKEARKILPEKIKNASQAIREWAEKNDKKSLKKFKVKTLEDIEAIYEDLSFEVRKILFTKIADITYKRKVGGFFWKDLMREVIAYKNEDGYRTGDIVKVIKFEQGDSIVNLEDLGIPPDPTYDTSFKGQSISNVQGRVSVFQVMRNAFDLIAEESGKEGRTMTDENAVGAQAFRTVQMRGLTDERFHQKLSPSSLDPRGYDPIKFKSKSGPERRSLEVRQAENKFMQTK